MSKQRTFLATCAVISLSWFSGLATVLTEGPARAATAVPASPKATLQRLNGSCERLLRMKTEPGSTEENRVKVEIKQYASELLDYTELCKRALGEHWSKMPEDKRLDFVATLKELIERNYIRQLRTNLDYVVNYGEESIDAKEAKVATALRLATKGKVTEVQIDYRLIQQPDGSWKVYDVITDELSLVRNYRTQFQRIIGGNNYDGLLSRMKSKLAEDKASEGGAKPAETASTPAPTPAPAGKPAAPTPAAKSEVKPGLAPAGKPTAAPVGKPATPTPAKPVKVVPTVT
ncbi:MAG: ABC transporter substrate-binding protein [Myxococcales bacterium]|nr:ABC transporter substrate-binding protein [Myxococcales bacterium]